MRISYIQIEQPIGCFYLASINAEDLIKIVKVTHRSINPQGVQRDLVKDRVTSITDYCSDPDAVFPTPIVINVESPEQVIFYEGTNELEIPNNSGILDVIDGQHRIEGIRRSKNRKDFNLPVVLMLNMTIEQKAYVFSTINSNQKSVPSSLIYDLFDVASIRSPQKTAHYIARTLNSTETSPFYRRLKMLGKKEKDQDKATLSQGTFVSSLLQLISKDPQKDLTMLKRGEPLVSNPSLCLRDYFIADRDDVITKIILNCFSALRKVFPNQWAKPSDNILWKTTGFRAIIYAFPQMYNIGVLENRLTEGFFIDCFEKFNKTLIQRKLTLTSDDFPGGGEQNQQKLGRIIVESITKENIDIQF